MGLFRKKQKPVDVPKEPSANLIQFHKLDHAFDEKLIELADVLKKNIPIVINFEQLEIDDINKSIAFLSGVCYAIDGEVIPVQEKILLFGNQQAFEDGTVKTFLKELN
jgi:FtsZ-interacting cell division protein YlmF